MTLNGMECHELLKRIEPSQSTICFGLRLIFLVIVLLDRHLFDCSSLDFQISVTS